VTSKNAVYAVIVAAVLLHILYNIITDIITVYLQKIKQVYGTLLNFCRIYKFAYKCIANN